LTKNRKFPQESKIFTKIEILTKNSNFSLKFVRFLILGQICDFRSNFRFWSKYRFYLKFLILGQIFDFVKISILGQIFGDILGHFPEKSKIFSKVESSVKNFKYFPTLPENAFRPLHARSSQLFR